MQMPKFAKIEPYLHWVSPISLSLSLSLFTSFVFWLKIEIFQYVNQLQHSIFSTFIEIEAVSQMKILCSSGRHLWHLPLLKHSAIAMYFNFVRFFTFGLNQSGQSGHFRHQRSTVWILTSLYLLGQLCEQNGVSKRSELTPFWER